LVIETPSEATVLRHEELRAFIRYSLSQLRSRNEHHRFEHLCEALARQRITPNIVVGSGPVSAGGDQGRDFESFRGFTQGHVRDLGTEMGIGDQETIVFCCTVGQIDVPTKIREDLNKLASTGTDVDVVVYFSEQDVPTAARHNLIDIALADHGIRLELIDGQTITSLLCDRDTFWVAVEFLDVPAHLAPESAGPKWYAASRARWLARTTLASTTGDVVEIATCLRFATFNDTFRGDIELWLARLAPLLRDGVDPVLQHRARYETAVARYRGLGDLRPADELVRRIMRDAAESHSADELDSADIVSQYAQGAWMFAATDLTAAEIDTLSENLEAQIERLVDTATAPDRRCRLLSLLGRARLRFHLGALEAGGFERGRVEAPPPMTRQQWEQFLAQRPAQRRKQQVSVIDADGALTAWSEAVELLGEAHLFPVQAFAEVVALRAGDLHDDARWRSLVSRLDAYVATAAGKQAAAELALSRSRSLRAAGRPLAALAELHLAREHLVGGDTTEEGAEALLEAAEIYLDLGLLYAAKHYSLASGAIAGADDVYEHPLIAASLIRAAYCDFLSGNWLSLMVLLPKAVDAHLGLREAPGELAGWHDFLQLLLSAGLVSQFVDRTGDVDLTKWLHAKLAVVGVALADVTGADATTLLPGPGLERAMELVTEILGQSAFADAGPTRAIRFAVRGVRWRIKTRNTYDEVRAAERFAAAVQTVNAVLGEDDLILAETTIEVKVRTVRPGPMGATSGRDPKPTGRASDGAHRWELILTRDLGPHSVEFLAATSEVAAAAIAILMSVSLLPDASVRSILDRVGRDGTLLRAAFPHIRYDRAYAVVSREEFAAGERRRLRPVGPEGFGEVMTADELGPIRDSGPVFRGETPAERVPGRYRAYARTLRITAPLLSRDERVRQVITKLRSEGWKDWHLLMAISNLVINYRLELSGEDVTDPAVRERLMRLDPEDPAEVQVDPALVTAEALQMHLTTSAGATANALGLGLGRGLTPDDVLQVLATRYGHWDHDADHDDPFAIPDASNNK
jgi:hypothetical protein